MIEKTKLRDMEAEKIEELIKTNNSVVINTLQIELKLIQGILKD